MFTFGPTCSSLLKWKTMWSKMQHQCEKVAMAGPSPSPHCSLWPTNPRSSYARDDASILSGRGFDMLGFWLWGSVLTDSNHASWSSETAHLGHFWENLPSIEWIRMTWRHEDMKTWKKTLISLSVRWMQHKPQSTRLLLQLHFFVTSQPMAAYGCSPGFCMSHVACYFFFDSAILIYIYIYILIHLRAQLAVCQID